MGVLGGHLKEQKMLVKALGSAGYGYSVGRGGLCALLDE